MKDRSVRGARSLGGVWSLVPIALVGVVLQASAAPRVELRGVRPDWLLLIAVYLGLRVPRPNAILGAWALGFFAELLTIERMGILSVAYALTAWWVGAIRGALVRGTLPTGAAVTFTAGLFVFGAWLGYRAFAEGPRVEWGAALWRECVGRAVYTAAWALPMHVFLWFSSSVLALSGAVRPARR